MDEESPVSKICFCNIIVLRPHAMLSKGSVDAAHHAVRLFNTFPKQFYISWKMHQAFITVGICIDCLKILYVWVPAISGGGNLAASKIRNLECPSYGLKDYGCGKFIRKNTYSLIFVHGKSTLRGQPVVLVCPVIRYDISNP